MRTRIRLRMRSLLEQGAAADDERRDADAYEGSRTPVVAVSLADQLLLFISYSSLAVSTRCSLPAGACRCCRVGARKLGWGRPRPNAQLATGAGLPLPIQVAHDGGLASRLIGELASRCFT